MSRIHATIIVGFIFSLAPAGLTPSVALSVTSFGSASISQLRDEERVNINTASIEELERLPGIGPALASRIVEHRRRHGLFKRPQDIVIVRGMSAKLYRRIAHLIRI